jgi:hypothetical protein
MGHLKKTPQNRTPGRSKKPWGVQDFVGFSLPLFAQEKPGRRCWWMAAGVQKLRPI